jgi:hypothetical protein
MKLLRTVVHAALPFHLLIAAAFGSQTEVLNLTFFVTWVCLFGVSYLLNGV